MAFKFGKSQPVAPIVPAPESATRVLPDSKETQALVESHVRLNEANANMADSMLDAPLPPDTIEAGDERITEHKLSRLIDDDFPFDESQLVAINGIANQRYACLTGAAGTGKTTSTKAIVDKIQNNLGLVDMRNYFKKSEDARGEIHSNDVDDDYEMPQTAIPSICLVGFTGRSSQMIKKNFPRDWHGNIMTIHRMLAFAPEFYEEFDSDLGIMRNKMRFTPTYNKHFKLPWDVIVIDEAGMVSIDLWLQVWDACKPGCRIIMIGDINQLPPVHGRSIFGFAMTKWPSWELTHIHRQVGVNNSIVDNAWKILKGIKPESDNYQSDPGWKFAMMPIPEDSSLASRKIRKWLEAMNGKAYQPHRDSVITAINAAEGGAGYALGQIPMNRELAIVFNKESPRYIIDAGRERKQFAVGDKVMATRNDHEAGITNGMTGIITSIAENPAYIGDRRRFGLIEEVSAYLNDEDDDDDAEFTLDEIADDMSAIQKGLKDQKESKERGPASHVVTVRFGVDEHSFELPFATLAEVASLMVAYVVTCHKMQGGESPLVVIICHQSHKQMLNREWLYTAVTRASHKCVLFFTDMGLRAALSKQRIKGTNLQEKVRVFQGLQTQGLTGAALKVGLPDSESMSTDVVIHAPTMLEQLPAKEESTESGKAALLKQIESAKARRAETQPESRVTNVYIDNSKHVHIHQTQPKRAVYEADRTQAEREQSKQEVRDRLDKLTAMIGSKAKPMISLVARAALPAPESSKTRDEKEVSPHQEDSEGQRMGSETRERPKSSEQPEPEGERPESPVMTQKLLPWYPRETRLSEGTEHSEWERNFAEALSPQSESPIPSASPVGKTRFMFGRKGN